MTRSLMCNSGSVEIDTPHLGKIAWEVSSELLLPVGLPGFESERRMIPLEIPAHRPLVFLQSAERPAVCFVSLPVTTICPDYKLLLTEEDCSALLLDETAPPEIGTDVLCLALLLPSGGTVKVNLDAPIVINLRNSRCVQSLSPEQPAGYYRLSDEGAWETLC